MSKSVLQDWVVDLPLRFQGTLLTAVRGCDDEPKLRRSGWMGLTPDASGNDNGSSEAAPVASPRDPSLKPLDDYLQAKALAEHPVASQATAPERPDGRHFIRQESFNDACQFYMDHLESRVRKLEAALEEARGIIVQYPPMVRNILGSKSVRNVSELEGQAKHWIEANHDRT